MRVVRDLSLRDVARQWDALAAERYDALEANTDQTFREILAPAVLGRINEGRTSDTQDVVDVGCGVGVLTTKIADYFNTRVTGVDISATSVELARRRVKSTSCTFLCSSVEDFASVGPSFDLAVANMVLMTTPDLSATVRAISNLLRPGGRLIATVPHPWFWPIYWEYSKEPWFSYRSEILIEGEFRTRSSTSSKRSVHVHRPLQGYLDALKLSAFDSVEVEELSDPDGTMFEYPRFLLIDAWVADGNGQIPQD